jgi:hypothetical protein
MKGNVFLKKRFIIPLSIILVITVILFFLSGFVKMWVEKNSFKMIGRRIEMRELHFNYFRCSATIKNFVMYEKKSRDRFVSFDELYVNFDPTRLMNKEYTCSAINLVHPSVNIVYNKVSGKSVFNFDDLMNKNKGAKDAPAKKDSAKSNIKYIIKYLNITEGHLKYVDLSQNSNQEINNLDLHLPYISWNSRKSKAGIEFTLGKKGKVSISAIINQVTGKYALAVKTEETEIAPFTNYLKSYIAVNLVSGSLYSNLNITGDMSKPTDLIVDGEASIRNAVMIDRNNEKFLTAASASIVFDSLDVGKSNYKFKKMELQSPELLVVRYKDKTNIQKILAPYLADTSSGDTTKTRYSINNLLINNGKVIYRDMALHREFNLELENIIFSMEGLSESAIKIPIKFSMNVNKTGSYEGKTVLSMTDLKNVVYNSTIKNVEMINFSPFTEYYISRPIIKGVVSYRCSLKMKPQKLDNLNNFKIVNLKFGKKTKDSLRYKVPVNLALYILKDSKGVINMEVPVEGKPSDPSFKLKKIIWKAVENFFLKTISQPFVAIGKMFGSNPESIKSIPFALLQDTLNAEQRQRLDKLSEIMLKKQELTFTFSQTTNPLKEKQLLAVSEVKYKFVSQNLQGMTDFKLLRTKANSIEDNDILLLKFIKLSVSDTTKPIGVRCLTMLGDANVDVLFTKLLQSREKLISDYLLNRKIPQQSIFVKTADLSNLPEEMKTPQFIVDLSMP